jgi:hypothetical protein
MEKSLVWCHSPVIPETVRGIKQEDRSSAQPRQKARPYLQSKRAGCIDQAIEPLPASVNPRIQTSVHTHTKGKKPEIYYSHTKEEELHHSLGPYSPNLQVAGKENLLLSLLSLISLGARSRRIP